MIVNNWFFRELGDGKLQLGWFDYDNDKTTYTSLVQRVRQGVVDTLRNTYMLGEPDVTQRAYIQATSMKVGETSPVHPAWAVALNGDDSTELLVKVSLAHEEEK